MVCDSGTAISGSVSAEPPIARKAFIADHEPLPDSQTVANLRETTPLPLFGTLSVADVKRRNVLIAHCQGGADTRVHPATQQHDRARFAACSFNC